MFLPQISLSIFLNKTHIIYPCLPNNRSWRLHHFITSGLSFKVCLLLQPLWLLSHWIHETNLSCYTQMCCYCKLLTSMCIWHGAPVSLEETERTTKMADISDRTLDSTRQKRVRGHHDAKKIMMCSLWRRWLDFSVWWHCHNRPLQATQKPFRPWDMSDSDTIGVSIFLKAYP